MKYYSVLLIGLLIGTSCFAAGKEGSRTCGASRVKPIEPKKKTILQQPINSIQKEQFFDQQRSLPQGPLQNSVFPKAGRGFAALAGHVYELTSTPYHQDPNFYMNKRSPFQMDFSGPAWTYVTRGGSDLRSAARGYHPDWSRHPFVSVRFVLRKF